jgi:hypothetical protein
VSIDDMNRAIAAQGAKAG